MIEIGKINTLRVVKEVDFGFYLDGFNFGEILLPKRYVPANTQVDDYVDVFLYFDSEDRLIATTEQPLGQVGDFVNLKVKDSTKVGAFLDWGLMKDLLVPFKEQRQEMAPGQSYMVYIFLDEKSQRIAASSKLDKYLDHVPMSYEVGDEVSLIVWEKTNLGYKVIVDNLHTGLVYANEIFTPLKPGQKIKGYIKQIREDEKLDISLQKKGKVHIDESAEMILNKLQKQGGYIEANDNTSPESIKHIFGISKKAFKKAIGSLYKERLIVIEDKGIRLIKKM